MSAGPISQGERPQECRQSCRQTPSRKTLAQVTIESLIAEAEAARAKAMAEKGGAAAAVSALTAKAKLAGMWRERIDSHNTGTMSVERIERVIVERDEPTGQLDIAAEANLDAGQKPWWAD